MQKIIKRTVCYLPFILILQIFTGCAVPPDSSYAATIDGTGISLPLFRLYLYEMQLSYESTGDSDIWETDFEGRSALETAKERTLVMIAYSYICRKKASSLGIVFDEEQIKTRDDDIMWFYNELEPSMKKEIGVSEDELDRFHLERLYYYEVFTRLTDEFEINESDFEQYYSEYVQESGGDPNNDEDKEQVRQIYVLASKQQIFISQLEQWLSDVAVERNPDVWEDIDLIGV